MFEIALEMWRLGFLLVYRDLVWTALYSCWGSLLPLSWGVDLFQPSVCAEVVDLEVPLEWGRQWELRVVDLEAGLHWAATSTEQRYLGQWVCKCFSTSALPFLWEPASSKLAAAGRSAWCLQRRTKHHQASQAVPWRLRLNELKI